MNALFSRYRVFEEINYKCLPQCYSETVWKKSANLVYIAVTNLMDIRQADSVMK
jgi:hypothetical protein